VWGLHFGHKSVVINYNRSPEIICFTIRVLFGTCTEHYFDDYISPDFMSNHKSHRRAPRDCGTQNALNSLHRMVGLILDEDKYIVSDYSNVFLGVSVDTSSVFSEHQYVDVLDITWEIELHNPIRGIWGLRESCQPTFLYKVRNRHKHHPR